MASPNIQVIAYASSGRGRSARSLYEVKIGLRHKYLPGKELKDLSGAKRLNQFKKVQAFLNTEEGAKWAINTPAVPLI